MAKATRAGRQPASSAKAAVDSGSAVTEGVQDIARAWAEYAQQVMQCTTEASEALVKCRNLSDMLGVQAEPSAVAESSVSAQIARMRRVTIRASLRTPAESEDQ